MRKTILCFILLLSFCITGCSTLGKDPNRIEECEGYGFFYNLNDFYTFATTASRDPAMYSDDWTAQNISWYPNVDLERLLKLEDMFPDEKLVENLYSIKILELANHYCYEFKNQISVTVAYDPEYFSKVAQSYSWSGDWNYITEDNTNRFVFDSKKEDVYVRQVSGITIFRHTRGTFLTVIDGYLIQIMIGYYSKDIYDSTEELMEDPQNRCFAAFFNDAELEEAVERLKTCIANKKAE